MKKVLLGFACMATAMCVNAQALKVTNTGNIKIGFPNPNPTCKLEIGGEIHLSMPFGGDNMVSGYAAGFIMGQYSHQYLGMNFQKPTIYGVLNNSLCIGHSAKWAANVYSYRIDCSVLYETSDMRLKENIRPCASLLSKLKDIQTYNYNFVDEYFKDFSSEEIQKAKKTEYGFLAQELQKVFPELVCTDDTNKYSINYIGMIPILTSVINELQENLENRDSVIDALQQKVASLESIVVTCCSGTKIQKNMQEFDLSNLEDANTEELKVYQNAPNPFNESTIISCYIPETIKKAELCIYDMTGSRLKCLTIAERGNTTIQIQAGQLAAGVYTYLLIGDGKNSDAKQMILTK